MTLHFTSATPDEVWPLIRDFHYSRRMPSNIQHIYGLRKDGGLFGDFGELVAAIVFSIPPTRWSEPVIELSRLVRAQECDEPLSGLVSRSMNRLKNHGVDLVVSFADWTQKHHGGIYQACGWNYTGKNGARMDGVVVNGNFVPGRSANSKWGTRSPRKLTELGIDAAPHYDEGKHLYWRALNVRGKTKAKRLGLSSQPYPKPNAARLSDAPKPIGVSCEHTAGAAPQ